MRKQLRLGVWFCVPAILVAGVRLQLPVDTFDFSSVWSPDGQKIAFVSRRDGNFEIYVMNADGTGVRRLTTDPATDNAPSWSPDGRRIAFVSERTGNRDIFAMDADGGNLVNLTNHPADDGERPAWTPDGTRIAFHTDRRTTGSGDIFIMNADGTDARPLVATDASELLPAWSRDGRLVYTSNAAGNRDLYIAEANGSSPRRMTHDTTYESYANWSPDGRHLVFLSFRNEDGKGRDPDLYKADLQTGAILRLTTTRDWDFDPDYSPDGTKITFNSRRDGRRGIFVMNADGSDQRKLTNLTPSPFIDLARRSGLAAALERYGTQLTDRAGSPPFVAAELVNLAWEWLDAGRTDESLRAARLAAEAYPELPGAVAVLNAALRAAGQTQPSPR